MISREIDLLRNTLENVEALLLGATESSKTILETELRAVNKTLKGWMFAVLIIAKVELIDQLKRKSK